MSDFVFLIRQALLVRAHSDDVDDKIAPCGRAHINTAYVDIHFMCLHTQNVHVDTREQAAIALGAALDAVQMRTDSKQIKEWYQSLWKVREEASDSKASVQRRVTVKRVCGHPCTRGVTHSQSLTQVYTHPHSRSHSHSYHTLKHSLTHSLTRMQEASRGLRTNQEPQVHGSLLLLSTCEMEQRYGIH